jgi:hypothetical protein
MKAICVGLFAVAALAGCFASRDQAVGAEADAGSAGTKSRVKPPASIGANSHALCRSGAVESSPIDKVDLLFMVDNSNSMFDEQASLKAQFPKLMQVLTSGRRGPDDPRPFPPVTDLHVGVVTSDMGIPGVNFGAGTGCSPDGGDDGRLQHAGHGQGCEDSYPAFLAYDAAQGGDADKLAQDFACVAAVGTGGCGFEQQLEAPLKALWPSLYTDGNGNVVSPNPITFLATTPGGTLGRGDVPAAQGGNAGFLRNDPNQGLSLIAIVVVSDEEDCSPRTTEHLKPPSQLPDDSPYRDQDINLRCFYNKSLLYDVGKRYLTGFQRLRPGNEQLVAFAAIVGVPTDLVDADTLSATDFADPASRDAYYERILNDDRMQERIDPSTNPGTGTGNLVPSCQRDDASGNRSVAYPPRRIVELAQLFGANGRVQSICQDDFSPAMNAIVDMMAHRIAAPCEP